MSATIFDWEAPREAALEVHLLGLVDFDAAQVLQERLAMQIAAGVDQGGALLICEHPPLVTIGREGSWGHVRMSPEEFAARRWDVRWITRGGGCITHVPGQIAAYPIIPLARRGIGIAAFREQLQAAIIETCRECRVAARQQPQQAGVWGRGGELAQVGIAVRSGVSMQGVFVNVCPRLDQLRLIAPAGRAITSLAVERRVPTSLGSVRESLIRRLASQLEYDRFHLHTGHPQLRRTRRVVAYA
ncbi:MAG: lipoyl(octanoyl) transferase LipB [Planctomycetales bacterium]